MSSHVLLRENELPLFESLSVERMPAHWLMARLGKRVLRPGGVETTRWLLETARVTTEDHVVEFAPGLATTAIEILRCGPKSYVGVERDASARAFTEHKLSWRAVPSVKIIHGDAANVSSLRDSVGSLVIGEAMLSMQPHDKKLAIIAEAHRLLAPGGRYGIHELAVTPDDINRTRLTEIQNELGKFIHVGVRIGTVSEWVQWVSGCGFVVEHTKLAPMRLLEPDRMLRDEGYLGTAKFLFNVIRTPGARRRLSRLRNVFRKYQSNLCAVALVARRPH